MAHKTTTLFPHRLNRDRSFDSICPVCFATIANEKSEINLAAFDRNHVCDPAVLAGRAHFRPRAGDLQHSLPQESIKDKGPA
jgi:hypothetical protein